MTPLLSKAVRRLDGWLNVISGVGAAGRRTDYSFAARAVLDDVTLEELFHGDPYASRICRVVPEEALRQGFTVQTGKTDVDGAIGAALDDLLAREKVKEGWTWARTFGGGAIFVGADDGRDPREPLNPAAVESVRFLTVLDRREMRAASWYPDPLSREYGEPETYRVTRTVNGKPSETIVHATRIVRFDGALATRKRRAQADSWGESELQRLYDALQSFNAAWGAAGTLLQDASQGVFKIKDLITMLAGDTQEALQTRLQLVDFGRSAARSIMIDADQEDYTRVETNLGGVPAMVDKFALLLAGAAEIPVTILMGQAPAGLNATGDSDVRWFYDRIRSAQQNYLRPRLEQLVRLLLLAKDGPTRGVEPATWNIHFPSLWQASPQEQAELRAKVAETDQRYIDAGVVTPEEVALSRFRPDGWSDETVIDTRVRRVVQAADRASPADTAAATATDTAEAKT